MADISYRANLKAATFPFLTELNGRSVIVRGQDQNFVNGLAAKESLDSSVGVPQIYYCHNVIPTDTGYKSISYQELVTSTSPSTVGYEAVYTLRDITGEAALFSLDVSGNCHLLTSGSTTWVTPIGAPAAATIAGRHVTVAFVSGITYLYFANVGCYIYVFATNTLTAVTLTGLVAADILGVSGNSGYLLAYSVDAIAWSSVLDPTDFTPSLSSGAGGGNVEGIRGEIVALEEVYGGVIVFASDNAVAAHYSGNPRYPYTFLPIPGAGGLRDPHYVASDVGSGSLFAYTESGLQSITLKSATSVFPDVTDYISGSLFEDYDELRDELTITDAQGANILKRIVLVADRYLILSYGIEELTHALYYDTAYKQFGRLKVEHVDCFELLEYPSGSVELPKKSIAFLSGGGGIKVLNTDIINQDASGVMLLGKFQYVRTNLIQMQGVEFENVNAGDNFELGLLPSLDGKNFEPIVSGYLLRSNGKLRKYGFRTTAVNHTLVMKGAFHAVSVQLTLVVAGGR